MLDRTTRIAEATELMLALIGSLEVDGTIEAIQQALSTINAASMVRSCPECGTAFTPKRKDQSCCSQTCYNRHNSRQYRLRKRELAPMRECVACPECHEMFTPRRSDQTYCSYLCRSRNSAREKIRRNSSGEAVLARKRDTAPMLECRECHEMFTPNRRGQTFCSDTCSGRRRARMWKQRRREAVPAA